MQNTLPEALPDATFLVTSAPGASKIIPVATPQMSVVGFGATKMVPQGTISFFPGLCEPSLYTKFLNVKFTLQKVNNINRGNFTIIIMNREISFSRVVFPFALKETVPQIHLFIIFQASMKDFLQKRDSKKEN